MQTIIGTLLDVTTYEGTWPSGDKRVEHTAHILDGIRTTQVTLANARPGEPGLEPGVVAAHKGERIALETYGRGGNNKRVYLTATRLLTADDFADALGLAAV